MSLRVTSVLSDAASCYYSHAKLIPHSHIPTYSFQLTSHTGIKSSFHIWSSQSSFHIWSAAMAEKSGLDQRFTSETFCFSHQWKRQTTPLPQKRNQTRSDPRHPNADQTHFLNTLLCETAVKFAVVYLSLGCNCNDCFVCDFFFLNKSWHLMSHHGRAQSTATACAHSEHCRVPDWEAQWLQTPRL